MTTTERIENDEFNETNFYKRTCITACEAELLYAKLFGESKMSKRARYNRVRNSCRSTSSHCNTGNYCLSTKNRRALDSNFRRYTKLVKKTLSSQCGQSTVEYAVVAAAVLSIVVALGFLANIFRDGIAIQHALSVASHHMSLGFGGVQDVFAY